MRKNTRVKRIKHQGYWVSVWVYRFIATEPNFWEGAVCITKSKRASCDWLENRKNKRSCRTNIPHTGAPSTTVYKAMSLFRSLILELPEDAVIFARPQSTSVEVISRYIERIGFIRSPLGDEPCWVLTTRSKEEALRQPLRNASGAA